MASFENRQKDGAQLLTYFGVPTKLACRQTLPLGEAVMGAWQLSSEEAQKAQNELGRKKL